MRTLAEGGEDVLNEATAMSASATRERRHNLVLLFSRMADSRNTQRFKKAESKGILMEVLVRTLREDQDPASRLAAVNALRNCDLDLCMAALKDSVNQDQDTKVVNGVLHHPVREAAIKVLEAVSHK